MRILIVEDEHKIANSIKKGLEQEQHAVDAVYNGREGYDFASSVEYDVMIVDLMLPDIDGIELTKRIRAKNIHTPILILTAKGQVEDKVKGLDSGADDYLVKPFAFTELLARLRALTRRPSKSNGPLLTYDNLTLDPTIYEVTREHIPVMLTRKEFALLEYLMRHPNTTVPKDQIINHVWNYDADILPNTVEVYIGYLRTKIDKHFPNSKPLIQTIRGFGYKLCLTQHGSR